MPNEEYGAKTVSLATDAEARKFELGDSAVVEAELERSGPEDTELLQLMCKVQS